MDGIVPCTAEVTLLCNVLNAYDAKVTPCAHILLLIKTCQAEEQKLLWSLHETVMKQYFLL